eukprot:2572-Heterococcus_DN1.PRE.2
MHPRDHRAQYIRAGEGVIAATQSANRDETVFGMDADKFNIHRKNNPHLAFGYGMHECVAEWLARAELQCVFNTRAINATHRSCTIASQACYSEGCPI